MFDRIALRYDLLNHLLSANFDRGWRRAAATELQCDPGASVLDLCGGTGDMSVALARAGRAGRVVCCDFSHAMLAIAGAKFRKKRIEATCLLLEADGLRLPFAEGSFDAVTVAFGVRNFADLGAGLRETHRVLSRGGRLIVLEFSTPSAPLLGGCYRFYLNRILPRLGDGISGACGPYGYLARTISGFPEPAVLAGRIREAGFAACGWSTRTGGVVAIHTAIKGL
jgi:demethylmenaquinone methyltransferase/2-methoxy-6-polyprenyl-1,4-benzoquinol methylase